MYECINLSFGYVGLTVAQSCGFEHVIVSSDYKSVINAVPSIMVCNSEMGRLIQGIRYSVATISPQVVHI